jgi:hypothetical protein
MNEIICHRGKNFGKDWRKCAAPFLDKGNSHKKFLEYCPLNHQCWNTNMYSYEKRHNIIDRKLSSQNLRIG